MINLKDCEKIVRSAIENPQIPPLGGFEELRERVNENRFSKQKIVYEDGKSKVIVKIKWDKEKFLFLYENKVIDKESGERIIGTDEAHGKVGGVLGFHGKRHLHSEGYTTSIPTILIDKIQHPILSLIICSETKDNQEIWIRKLANELKDSFEGWEKNPRGTFNKKS